MPGSRPPLATGRHQAVPPRPPQSPPNSSVHHNNHHPVSNGNGRSVHAPDHPPPPRPSPPPTRFSWSSSLLTMLTTLGCFAVLCVYASAASTRFALHAAAPVYGLYPPLVAAMLVGGCCALVCYAPTMLAVLVFHALFGTDIRTRRAAPPGQGRVVGEEGAGAGTGTGAGTGMGWSVLRDGASTIKLALVVAPAYVMALGRGLGGGGGGGGSGGLMQVQSRALDAAAGGQLAAAVMTLKIMLVGVREIWDLVPLVMFRWDRDRDRGARTQEREHEHEHE